MLRAEAAAARVRSASKQKLPTLTELRKQQKFQSAGARKDKRHFPFLLSTQVEGFLFGKYSNTFVVAPNSSSESPSTRSIRNLTVSDHKRKHRTRFMQAGCSFLGNSRSFCCYTVVANSCTRSCAAQVAKTGKRALAR